MISLSRWYRCWDKPSNVVRSGGILRSETLSPQTQTSGDYMDQGGGEVRMKLWQ